MLHRLLLAGALLALLPSAALAGGGSAPRGMARIAAGSFHPLFGHADGRPTTVRAFALDTLPVSERDFLAFVKQQPRWAAGQTPHQFADDGYLRGTTGDPRRPVKQVSWFAAAAYCTARGARLPTTIEWEYAAQADENNRAAASTTAFRRRALDLALRSKPAAFTLGSGLRNVWGVRDLHGGLLEWTLDFQPGAGNEHAAQGGPREHKLSCAGGTVQTGDAGDYAAFLRYAFRSTADTRTTAANVGFRCAASL